MASAAIRPSRPTPAPCNRLDLGIGITHGFRRFSSVSVPSVPLSALCASAILALRQLGTAVPPTPDDAKRSLSSASPVSAFDLQPSTVKLLDFSGLRTLAHQSCAGSSLSICFFNRLRTLWKTPGVYPHPANYPIFNDWPPCGPPQSRSVDEASNSI
jgi:hypothetical protein